MLLEKLEPYEIFTLRPDAFWIWNNEEVKERLSWYYQVMINKKPAKFIIAKHIESPVNPYEVEDQRELWKIHDSLEKEFVKIYKEIRNDRLKLEELHKPKYSFLDVKIALAKSYLKNCRLCEWKCGVNRLSGRPGICMMDKDCIVHSYFHHMGEEAPLVPSGTIFYGGCNFRCVYCQNYDISQLYARHGERVDSRKLAIIQETLRKTGARNINHVGGEPTPHIPFIVESFKYLNINVPQLWNSNMYLSLEAMKIIKDLIDIWLPDFKYGNNQCAWRYSKARNYWEIITRNIKIAYQNGDMIIRHLVLPNHIECCTRKVLEWIAKNTPRALVNIMDQYRPEHLVAKYPEKFPEIARRPYRNEILEAYKIADELGILYKPIS
ncbi:radical SAM protein [Staphylothermus marinus]|uniref:radical SAM protein n=1 Tax=Staphylothermus marinus TaxID=2280 RepID=UPI00032340F6|nr:radical SAM protein [Staphylothermus marinus]